MAYLYDVHFNNGQAFTVTTDQHHDQHSEDAFRRHLLDVITQATGRVVGEVIVRVIFKGRK